MDPRQAPTTFQTWLKAFEVLQGPNRMMIFKVGLLSFFVPHLVHSIISPFLTTPIVNQLQTQSFNNFETLLSPVYGFLLSSLMVSGAALIFFIAGYAAIVKISCAHFREEKVDFNQSIFFGLKKVFPQGLIIYIFTILMSLESLFLGSFRMFTLFSLMSMVIVVNEKKGAFSSIKNAMFFRYSSPIYGGGFAAIFVLIGLGALIFACEYSLNYLHQFILHADELLNISRDLWMVGLPFTPIGPMMLLGSLVYAAGNAAIYTLIACFTASLYFSVHSQINHNI